MITKDKVKDFIEEHKVALTIAAVSVVGIAICTITKGKSSKYIDIDRPELTTGEWAQLFRGVKGKYAGSITGCAKAVDLTDLGNFGDALATIEGIDPHEPIRIVFGTEKSYT
jgi:hypothetical protein